MPDIEETGNTVVDWWQRNIWGLITKPAEKLNNGWKKIQRKDPANVFYHRRYRRVPGIDTCDVGDGACFYEANQQFKRDRLVETKIVEILGRKFRDCQVYYMQDAEMRCAQIELEYEKTQTNFFIKYGDIGWPGNVVDAWNKQKHRMIWERRHGAVGSGMKQEEPNIDLEAIKACGAHGSGGGVLIGDAFFNIKNPANMRLKDGGTTPCSFGGKNAEVSRDDMQ